MGANLVAAMESIPIERKSLRRLIELREVPDTSATAAIIPDSCGLQLSVPAVLPSFVARPLSQFARSLDLYIFWRAILSILLDEVRGMPLTTRITLGTM